MVCYSTGLSRDREGEVGEHTEQLSVDDDEWGLTNATVSTVRVPGEEERRKREEKERRQRRSQTQYFSLTLKSWQLIAVSTVSTAANSRQPTDRASKAHFLYPVSFLTSPSVSFPSLSRSWKRAAPETRGEIIQSQLQGKILQEEQIQTSQTLIWALELTGEKFKNNFMSQSGPNWDCLVLCALIH